MSGKNKLPDSLELLLDTMCNTFGAIMFIAISLVVISQMTTKVIKDKKPPEITEDQMNRMREKVDALVKEVREAEVTQAKNALSASGMSASKKDKIGRLLDLKSKNQGGLLDNARQRAQNAANASKLDSENQKLAGMQSEGNILASEVASAKKSVEQMKNAIQDKRKDLENQRRQLANMVDELNGKKANMPKQTLTFSMETEITSEKQYVICLKNRRLYRMDSNEVTAIQDSEHTGHFSFSGSSGNVVSSNASGRVARLLAGVNRNRYVTVFCDSQSYPILVEIRKFSRNRGVKMSFIHTEDFSFYMGGKAKASY